MHNWWSLSTPCSKSWLSLPAVGCLVESSFHKHLVWMPCASISGPVCTPCLICLAWRGFDCMNAWKISVLCENICLCSLAKRLVCKHCSWWWCWCLSTHQTHCSLWFFVFWKSCDLIFSSLQSVCIGKFCLQKQATFQSVLAVCREVTYRCTLFSISKFQQNFKASLPGTLNWNKLVFVVWLFLSPFLPKKSIAASLIQLYCIALYLKVVSFRFATLARFFEMQRPIVRGHPLEILPPAKTALSLQITVMFRLCKTQFSLVIHNYRMGPLLLHRPKSESKVFHWAGKVWGNNNSLAMCLQLLWVHFPFRNSECLQILRLFYELFTAEKGLWVAFVQWEENRW